MKLSWFGADTITSEEDAFLDEAKNFVDEAKELVEYIVETTQPQEPYTECSGCGCVLPSRNAKTVQKTRPKLMISGIMSRSIVSETSNEDYCRACAPAYEIVVEDWVPDPQYVVDGCNPEQAYRSTFGVLGTFETKLYRRRRQEEYPSDLIEMDEDGNDIES